MLAMAVVLVTAATAIAVFVFATFAAAHLFKLLDQRGETSDTWWFAIHIGCALLFVAGLFFFVGFVIDLEVNRVFAK